MLESVFQSLKLPIEYHGDRMLNSIQGVQPPSGSKEKNLAILDNYTPNSAKSEISPKPSTSYN
jgi:hypothetical protein